jgi:hypothetical protein
MGNLLSIDQHGIARVTVRMTEDYGSQGRRLANSKSARLEWRASALWTMESVNVVASRTRFMLADLGQGQEVSGVFAGYV